MVLVSLTDLQQDIILCDSPRTCTVQFDTALARLLGQLRRGLTFQNFLYACLHMYCTNQDPNGKLRRSEQKTIFSVPSFNFITVNIKPDHNDPVRMIFTQRRKSREAEKEQVIGPELAHVSWTQHYLACYVSWLRRGGRALPYLYVLLNRVWFSRS